MESTCSHCKAIKPIDEFKAREKSYKTCTHCREKNSQQKKEKRSAQKAPEVPETQPPPSPQPTTPRICTECATLKPIEDFLSSKTTALCTRCKSCRDKKAEYQRLNADKIKQTGSK